MNKRQKIQFYILSVIALVFLVRLALWWFSVSLIPENFQGLAHVFDILLFFVVTYVIWHPIMMEILSWLIASNIKPQNRKVARPGYRVAFITNFVPGSESIDLLLKTLPAMVAVKYPHDTWLLDEGDDPKVKQLCRQLGVHHYSRKNSPEYNMDDGKFAAKTKGGNHNSWYDSHGNNYDFVAQIDTDFIPDPAFLTKTLGYFEDPRVAFVGTPQVYGNLDDSLIAKGAAEQTYSFYGPILRGLYGMESTFLIGANHVIRVSALRAVDHYSAHITEDLLTGMKLHSHGWTSVYVHEKLAVGEGPTDWKSYFQQQMRWAYGCIDILFKYSPSLYRKMSARRVLYYFLMQQHYFSGLAMLLGIFALGLYFLLGYSSANISTFDYLQYFIPVYLTTGIMAVWIQKFNVDPKQERGLLLPGKIISIAAWPVYLIAFWRVLTKRKIGYKVTPKGKVAKGQSSIFQLFWLHIILGLLCLFYLVSSIFTDRQAPVLVFWAFLCGASLLFAPVAEKIITVFTRIHRQLSDRARAFYKKNRLFEFNAYDPGVLPKSPTKAERYIYISRKNRLLQFFSVISFSCVMISGFNFVFANQEMWLFGLFLGFSVVYFVISAIVNFNTSDFSRKRHQEIVANWHPEKMPSVDIFLPSAGESTNVLLNTWSGVIRMARSYSGQVKIYCLDDSGRKEVELLAGQLGLKYLSRPDKGVFKKAGNLRYGFQNSSGDLIAIFDADFRPSKDFLNELVPYFSSNPRVGIVQTPQYFEVAQFQNWLERGAGAVQEFFYRYSQVSRQYHDASICVGSNAIYRRRALNDTGGTALIEHSEDVHTGFNLRMKGWTIEYLPLILAKGLCPSSLRSFFNQQYRWCRGSMSLLGSKKFWGAQMPFRMRMSYFSGFLYYSHTAIASLLVPVVPLALLFIYPEQIQLYNYILLLPSFVLTQVVMPLWHRADYGIEAWATKMVYGWAHLFAIIDSIRNKSMPWQPTGAKTNKNRQYVLFRVFQFVLNFVPASVWALYSLFITISTGEVKYLPLLISGWYFLAVSSKVCFYSEKGIVMKRQIRLKEKEKNKYTTLPRVALGLTKK